MAFFVQVMSPVAIMAAAPTASTFTSGCETMNSRSLRSFSAEDECEQVVTLFRGGLSLRVQLMEGMLTDCSRSGFCFVTLLWKEIECEPEGIG